MGIGQSTAVTINDGYSTYSDIVGRVKSIKIGHTWTVNNFHDCCKRRITGEAIVSPIFFAGFDNRYKWRLVLYPCGDNEQNKNYISLYLQLVDDKDDNLAVKTSFSLSLINNAGEQVNKLKPSKRHCFVKDRTLWGYGRFISHTAINDNGVLQGSPKNARLTIFCENSDNEPTDNVPAECNLLHVIVCESVLKASSDFEVLLQNHSLSDATLTASCGEKFHVHKAILAARSPVFAAMFEHDMREKAESELYIEDIRREIIAEMLRFIYSGRVVDIENTVYELLAAADKYALDDLKSMCEEVLLNRLTIVNAVDLLIFADLHNAKNLKLRIEAYIIEHSKDIAETQGFKTAMSSHPHLIAEVFQKMALQQ